MFLTYKVDYKATLTIILGLLLNMSSVLSQEVVKAILYRDNVHVLIEGGEISTRIKKYDATSGRYTGVLTYLKKDHNFNYGFPWEIGNDDYVALHNSVMPGMGGAAFFEKYEIEEIDSLALYNRMEAEWNVLIEKHGGFRNALLHEMNGSIDYEQRIFLPFKAYTDRLRSGKSYYRADFFRANYDFSLFGKNKDEGIVGFKSPFGFEIWKFNLDSIKAIRNTLNVLPQFVSKEELLSPTLQKNSVDSNFLLSPFFLSKDEFGQFIIDYTSGYIYSIDSALEFVGQITLREDYFYLLEDLDEECLWVNGVIVWKDEGYKRPFIREIGDEYRRVMNEIRRQN
jgi:hypothetical protein